MAKFYDNDDQVYASHKADLPMLDQRLSINSSAQEGKIVIRMDGGKGSALTDRGEADKLIAAITAARDTAFPATA